MLLRYPAAFLAIVAVVLLAPSLLTGVITTHSSAHNLTWAEQFADQFRSGVIYPRWMPDSFDGLGSPAFYFYPPLAFWTDSLLSVVSLNILPVPWRLGLVSILILWASGVAMYAWLFRVTASARAATIGAAAYMAGPYHLLDHYMRGALAELAAYALLPCLMLSLQRLADRRRFSVPVVALAYAGLVTAHLPMALLVSVTLLPAYALFRAWRMLPGVAALRFLASGAIAVALGAGLAAIYLVPALGLQDWISSEQLWKPFYRPENWLLTRPEQWPEPAIMGIIGGIAVACAIMCGALFVVLFVVADDQPDRLDLCFWTISCFVGLLLIGGLVPWFWELPFIAKVQFPWRLMVAIEFAAITALCLVPVSALRRPAIYAFVAAAVVLVTPLVMIGRDAYNRIVFSQRVDALERRDVKEYQPRGYPQNDQQGHGDLGLEPLGAVPSISCAPPAAVCRAEPGLFGEMRVEIDSNEPTEVVLRRFFFPAWRLNDGISIAPTSPLRLVTFALPAGSTRATLHRIALPEERWGWIISGISALLLLAIAAVGARNRVR